MEKSNATLEDDYWNILPTLTIEERQRLVDRNTELAWRLRRLLLVNTDVDTGPVYIGVYPSSELFQATTALVKSGTVILIYEKLLKVATEVAEVVAAVFPGRIGGKDVPTSITEAEAQQLLRHILSSTEESFSGHGLKLAEPQIVLAQMLAGLLVNFVIAHEFAHAVLGHLSGPTRRLKRKAGMVPRISLPSWQMEMAADTQGFRIARSTYDRVHPETQYLGAVLFFEIQEMTSALLSEAEPELIYDLDNISRLVTHPPASTRRTNLITSTHPDGQGADLPAVNWLVDFMAKVRGKVAPALDADALEQLRLLAIECNLDRYTSVLRIGEAQDGVTFYDTTAVFQYIEESHEQARAALAFTALGLLTVPPAQNEAFRVQLGLLYSVYSQVYLNRPNEYADQAASFDILLRVCVYDFDEILIEFGRVVGGQFDKPDREPNENESPAKTD